MQIQFYPIQVVRFWWPILRFHVAALNDPKSTPAQLTQTLNVLDNALFMLSSAIWQLGEKGRNLHPLMVLVFRLAHVIPDYSGLSTVYSAFALVFPRNSTQKEAVLFWTDDTVRHIREGVHASVRKCVSCGTVPKDVKVCGKCREARYCNQDCQRAHWPLHKVHCGTRSLKELMDEALRRPLPDPLRPPKTAEVLAVMDPLKHYEDPTWHPFLGL